MAVLNVNPTRMELTNLKRKLVTARRGHKLLKDKRDELMRRFMDLIRENKELRKKVEDAVTAAGNAMATARSVTPDEVIDTALMMPKQEVSLEIKNKNVMSVLIPEYSISFKTSNPHDIFSYGFAYTSADTDVAVSSLADILPDMIRLAEVEKSCQLMASEIEKTRRRVNALDFGTGFPSGVFKTHGGFRPCARERYVRFQISAACMCCRRGLFRNPKKRTDTP